MNDNPAPFNYLPPHHVLSFRIVVFRYSRISNMTDRWFASTEKLNLN